MVVHITYSCVDYTALASGNTRMYDYVPDVFLHPKDISLSCQTGGCSLAPTTLLLVFGREQPWIEGDGRTYRQLAGHLSQLINRSA